MSIPFASPPRCCEEVGNRRYFYSLKIETCAQGEGNGCLPDEGSRWTVKKGELSSQAVRTATSFPSVVSVAVPEEDGMLLDALQGHVCREGISKHIKSVVFALFARATQLVNSNPMSWYIFLDFQFISYAVGIYIGAVCFSLLSNSFLANLHALLLLKKLLLLSLKTVLLAYKLTLSLNKHLLVLTKTISLLPNGLTADKELLVVHKKILALDKELLASKDAVLAVQERAVAKQTCADKHCIWGCIARRTSRARVLAVSQRHSLTSILPHRHIAPHPLTNKMKLFVAIAAAAKTIFSAPSINMVNAGESRSLYERLAIAANELPSALDGEPSAEEVNLALAVMHAAVAILDNALLRKLTCAPHLTKFVEIHDRATINMVNARESRTLYERLAVAANELSSALDGEPSAEEVNFALAVMRAMVAILDDALLRKLTCAPRLIKILQIHHRATDFAQTHVSEEAWQLLYDELAEEMRDMIGKFGAESNLAFSRYIQIQQLLLELWESRSSLETVWLAHSWFSPSVWHWAQPQPLPYKRALFLRPAEIAEEDALNGTIDRQVCWFSPSVWHWAQPQPLPYERALFLRPAEIAEEDALNGTIGVENSFVAHLARQEASIRGDSSPKVLDFLWPTPVNTSSAFLAPAGNKRKAQEPPADSSSRVTRSHLHTLGTVTLHLPASAVTSATEVNAQQITTHFDLPAFAITSAAGSVVGLPQIMMQLPDPSCFPPGLKMFLPELHVHLPVTFTKRPPSVWLRHNSGLIVPGK
ncbi:hypothetical protein IE81DRAFT_329689 [Ceraceosorus guamensis]|uniref:Uncharacterized protein n=1 Tax=Ceraceosorus guamensis TaxID=1522189 RepID=A0A316W283_9BASI|nr:hypothetical protein IE81DRAFT_329689 [Ceraceosorus guamensis]PWN43198.1 hypothetical protein IE81DRAFT_329689 [Ceraceosorus guamensis]